jgi:hypothetical protein
MNKIISNMIKTRIGTNAGKIWRFLNQNGESSIPELRNALSMKGSDVSMALGWLARENKICFSEDENGIRGDFGMIDLAYVG